MDGVAAADALKFLPSRHAAFREGTPGGDEDVAAIAALNGVAAFLTALGLEEAAVAVKKRAERFVDPSKAFNDKKKWQTGGKRHSWYLFGATTVIRDNQRRNEVQSSATLRSPSATSILEAARTLYYILNTAFSSKSDASLTAVIRSEECRRLDRDEGLGSDSIGLGGSAHEIRSRGDEYGLSLEATSTQRVELHQRPSLIGSESTTTASTIDKAVGIRAGSYPTQSISSFAQVAYLRADKERVITVEEKSEAMGGMPGAAKQSSEVYIPKIRSSDPDPYDPTDEYRDDADPGYRIRELSEQDLMREMEARCTATETGQLDPHLATVPYIPVFFRPTCRDDPRQIWPRGPGELRLRSWLVPAKVKVDSEGITRSSSTWWISEKQSRPSTTSSRKRPDTNGSGFGNGFNDSVCDESPQQRLPRGAGGGFRGVGSMVVLAGSEAMENAQTVNLRQGTASTVSARVTSSVSGCVSVTGHTGDARCGSQRYSSPAFGPSSAFSVADDDELSGASVQAQPCLMRSSGVGALGSVDAPRKAFPPVADGTHHKSSVVSRSVSHSCASVSPASSFQKSPDFGTGSASPVREAVAQAEGVASPQGGGVLQSTGVDGERSGVTPVLQKEIPGAGNDSPFSCRLLDREDSLKSPVFGVEEEGSETLPNEETNKGSLSLAGVVSDMLGWPSTEGYDEALPSQNRADRLIALDKSLGGSDVLLKTYMQNKRCDTSGDTKAVTDMSSVLREMSARHRRVQTSSLSTLLQEEQKWLYVYSNGDSTGHRLKKRQLKPTVTKHVSHPESAEPFFPAVDKNGTVVDSFHLKIVFERGRTGFEHTKELQVTPGMIIAARFVVECQIGEAAFSKALKCYDQYLNQWVCIKVIKNDKDFVDQCLDEIKLLRYINHNADVDAVRCVRLMDFFYYKEHLIIVTELLKENLYEFGRKCQARHEVYYTMGRVQKIAFQILKALQYVHSLFLIHSDLKPENILLKDEKNCSIKVIDFGSSCFEDDNLSHYVQSRSYRAPEVLLGLPYDQKIDIWSLGCILAELWTGYVLFQNDSVTSLLCRIAGIIGPFPFYMIDKGQNVPDHFTADGQIYQLKSDTPPCLQQGRRLKILLPKLSSLEQRLRTRDHLFVDFLTRLLQIDPVKRMTAQEALSHPWLTPGRYTDGL